MIAAEEINVVWTEIQTYFHDLNLSLMNEMKLLEDRISYINDGKIIEFNLEKNGIRFVKEVLTIQVVKIQPDSAELLSILKYKNSIVVNEENNIAFCESLIDEWVEEAIEVHLTCK